MSLAFRPFKKRTLIDRTMQRTLPDPQFVSFQVDRWDGPWQNRQGFLSELGQRREVLFVTPPFNMEDLLGGPRASRTKLLGMHALGGKLHSFAPSRLLPRTYRFRWLDRTLLAARTRQLRGAIKRAGIERPINLVFHPNAAIEWPCAMQRPLVYYKYDHYPGYGGVPPDQQRFLNATEEQLVAQADLVLVTSQGLYDLHANDAPGRLHLLPNGVDYQSFRDVIEANAEEPADLAAIPRPRVGYVGVINDKVDSGLLLELSKRRPEYSFVLVGPAKGRSPEGVAALEKLRAQPNVHLLGPKSHSDVPRYLAGLDAGMMCYVLTEWMKLAYPLKLHEYLATGLPTVAAPLPDLEAFPQVVAIANSADEWAAALDSAIATRRDPVLTQRRLQIAQENSWSRRVDAFLSLVQGISR